MDSKLTNIFAQSNLPEFSVVMVNIDGTQFIKSYGMVEFNSNKIRTSDFKQNIASISKTFIGIALMKLVEQNKLELSTPINEILPFNIINPKFPQIKITVAQLASHTSSIEDKDIENRSWYSDDKLSVSKKEMGKDNYKVFKQWEKKQKT